MSQCDDEEGDIEREDRMGDEGRLKKSMRD
jgi:hypothetical protein